MPRYVVSVHGELEQMARDDRGLSLQGRVWVLSVKASVNLLIKNKLKIDLVNLKVE